MKPYPVCDSGGNPVLCGVVVFVSISVQPAFVDQRSHPANHPVCPLARLVAATLLLQPEQHTLYHVTTLTYAYVFQITPNEIIQLEHTRSPFPRPGGHHNILTLQPDHTLGIHRKTSVSVATGHSLLAVCTGLGPAHKYTGNAEWRLPLITDLRSGYLTPQPNLNH